MELLFSSDEPLYDICVYHAQQCAEKALKAYLTLRMKEIEKSHNLLLLVENCIVHGHNLIISLMRSTSEANELVHILSLVIYYLYYCNIRMVIGNATQNKYSY